MNRAHTTNRPIAALLALPLLLSASALPGCAHLGEPKGSAGLKVSKVVLYQNGVGYFERRGVVRGKKLEVRVRPDQINDVLKSLTVLERKGGRASSVTLPVERSSDRLAAELPAQVRNARGMIGLLQVLRGIEVSIDAGDDDFRGRVVGVEGGGRGARVTLMAGKRKLVAVRVAKIDKVRIHDKALASGLARSLDISKNEGKWKPVSVTLRFADKGPHDLLLSYILEVPVWRPAYRAWVDKKRNVRLSGWAVIDNVSGEDWKQVELSLVVGSPLSFRYNLHRPHHVTRPNLSARLPQTAAAPPPPDVGYRQRKRRSYAGKVASGMLMGAGSGGGGRGLGGIGLSKKSKLAEDEAADAPMPSRARRPRSYRPRPKPAPRSRWTGAERQKAIAASATALVSGRKVGALYRYDALEPVTVPDGQAALIPIVDRTVPGEDVFLFRSPSAQTPYRAVLLRNGDKDDTGAKGGKGGDLESGPITLYVDGTFAGEGFLGRMERGTTAFVPYARESGLKVRNSYRNDTKQMRLVRIVGGRISVEAKRHFIRTYTVHSERSKPSVAYVKLHTHSTHKLVDPPKDMVRSGNDIYVRIEVPAKGKGKVVITEASPIRRTTTYLSSMVLAAFKLFLADATAQEAVKGPIRELLALHDQRGELGRQRSTLFRQRNLLRNDARRIRRNLDSLPSGRVAKKLRKQLVKQLEANSAKAADVAKQLVEIEVKQAALAEKIKQLIGKISLK